MKLSSALILTIALIGSARAQCPDFTTFSQKPQGNPSSGPLALPLMRVNPECRTFNSTAVEKVITDMKARLKDPDIARLFENTYPNTLDTTVKYFSEEENLAFIITGDITAQWLRDTGNQFAAYTSILALDPSLATLVKAVINNEARYVSAFPYCGSFQPPPESGLAPSHNSFADLVTVDPPVDNRTVFECKYELDSLCGFLKLSRNYYTQTKDTSIFNDRWYTAINQIFRVVNEQSQSNFDADFNWVSFYNWTGRSGSLSPPVNNAGAGERGRLRSKTAQGKNVTEQATLWSKRTHDAIWNTTASRQDTLWTMPTFRDASLLSLPYLGFLDMNDRTYVATRKLLLSRANPYFSVGANFSGIGGPHVDAWNPWPMSQITAIFGTDNDDEIMTSLYLIANNTAGLGLIHESQSIYDYTSYTRSWFAWANSYFAEMVLDLAKRKPGLIFKTNEPYVPGQR
ncbi:Six-hairpin glycosidase-like protein [Mycena leptocephala]|nr:Six-hairpin glycosidase-like protein [Mycena leptocephala]